MEIWIFYYIFIQDSSSCDDQYVLKLFYTIKQSLPPLSIFLPTSDNFFFLHIQSYHCTFFFLHTQSYHCTFFFSTHNSITVQIFSPHTILSQYNFFPVQAFKIYVNIPVPLTILSKGYNSNLNRNGSTSEIQGNIICTYI